MFKNYLVNVPSQKGKIYLRKARNTKGEEITYVEYERGRTYSKERKNTSTNRTTIGKITDDDPSKMFPNDNYYQLLDDPEYPEEDTATRSGCLKAGAYYVIRKIIKDAGIEEILDSSLPQKDTGLFLDLCAYSIISEDNAAQYYPDYAYNHLLFSKDMHICSDSRISSFLKDININNRLSFIDRWVRKKGSQERIYFSYDSTDKRCQAGDIDIVEAGISKEGTKTTLFNYSIVYDSKNRDPLFYERYSGSINDVSELKYMIDKILSCGYSNICMILDRGYFSKANIRYMDTNGIDFLMMVKGNKKLVNELILSVKGAFEDKYLYHIGKYDVNGISVKHRLFEADREERFFHIFYSPEKYSFERGDLMEKLEDMRKELDEAIGKDIRFPENYHKYYELIYKDETVKINDQEGKEIIKDVSILSAYIPRSEIIDNETSLCGYFAIITSKQMKAEEAYVIYKSRDASEKLFRADKSYLGSKANRVYSNESTESKIFISFVALIIRNRIYTSLLDETLKNGYHYNYMSVPAAVKELEKIELIKTPSGAYILDHALTKAQKIILKAFDINHHEMVSFIGSMGKKMKELSNS